MKNIRINLTDKIRPLLKSARQATTTAKAEVKKACKNTGQVLRDIESGKLNVVATITVTKKK